MKLFITALIGSFLLYQTASANPDTAQLVPRTWNGQKYGCKCYFGDQCWPDSRTWNALNTTVDGNLAVYVPPEAACHTFFNGTLGTISTYDQAKCDTVTANYSSEKWITDQDMLLLWRYWTNSTCLPTTESSSPCTLGYYGVYLLKATKIAHIKAGVDFARRNNIRLVVRNSGHDFVGRSTGWGALVINTHSFQDIKFVDKWDAPGGYSGGAVTIAAGVQGRPLLRQAVAQKPPVTVVTGECPTVGVAGGYVQGGGHGPLTTQLGFAADNALSFDVITADGEYVTANAKENPDLFWALKGGGPAAFAVVVSATFKTFPEMRSAGATLYINSTHVTNETLYWEGVRIFHSHANSFVDAGLYVYFTITPLTLRVRPWVAFNQTAAGLDAILAPFKADLTAAGIPFENTPAKEYTTFFDLYIDLFEDESGGTPMLTSGWMFSRQDIAANNDGIITAFKKAISPREDLVNKGYMVGHLWNAGYGVPVPNSATNPRFRDAANLILYNLPVPTNATLEQKADIEDLLANTLDRTMRATGPKGCAYINEADPLQENWQDHFWGPDVYPKLLETRKKWDPHGVFYAISTPGTEDWEVIEYGTRLCKKL
ncbi:6-hydroxy-D-nicotine oxidase [Echria macrotheca]|uniref:6-hydroxy-D-nicotine oxidase n=1 Tax=Echria macrotheca TaxID=438768 RepID=A0AAJ0F6Q6_9PEZI|nr:6-hydroxy-D-nicotine oxidase [Echria macrotheca]